MYDQIVEHSPGAASINEIIRLRRAQERAAIIGRTKHRTLTARLGRIADREGVMGERDAS